MFESRQGYANMKIKLDTIKEGLNEFEGTFRKKALDIDCLQKDVTARLNIIKKGKKVEIKGKLDFCLTFNCSRCLNDFTCEFCEEIDTLFLPGFSGAPGKEGLSDEDLLISFYDGHEINLLSLICDTILLTIPMKPLCSESCKGLCPSCGKDLNEGSCECNLK